MMATLKYKQTLPGSYQVIWCGIDLGEVTTSWTRLGGQGWAVVPETYTQAGKTRHEAAQRLVSRARRELRG